MRELVVMLGPIGSGKSTVATLVARCLSRAGRYAAVVDLDDIVFMQHVRTVELDELWARGGAAHAALVAAWFELGVEVVIAHGPFLEPGLDPLLRAVPATTSVRYALLRVPYEVALERVRNDPGRAPGAVSRDPEFLRRAHERFLAVANGLPEPDWTFDTLAVTAREAADKMAVELLSGVPQ